MSIKHFHALSNKRKNIFLKEPEKFTAKEKLDGSNFIFGMTDGALWTARKSTTIKFYNSNEWPAQMWAQNFRITHEALEQLDIRNAILTSVGPNFTAHCELLSPLSPNAITYYQDVLAIVVYDGHQMPNVQWAHTSNVLSSDDGVTITSTSRTLDFSLSNLDDSAVYTASLVHNAPKMDESKIPQFLIDEITHNTSAYGDTRPEGYVFTHTDGWMFKVVDMQWFTQQNTTNYQFRKLLFKTPGQKTTSLMDTYTQNIASGMSVNLAANTALAALTELRLCYLRDPSSNVDSHIHRRNLEAMASLYQQLIVEVIWVD